MASLSVTAGAKGHRTGLSPRRALLLFASGAGLYAALVAVWLATGLDRRYDDGVLEAAKLVVPGLTHFPIGSSVGVEMLEIQDRGHVLVVILALAILSRVSLGSAPLARYTALALVAVGCHVLGLALQLHLALALKVEHAWGTALLLPWEQAALTWAAQLTFLAGMQVVGFLALMVTAWGFIGADDRPTGLGKPVRLLAVVGLAGLLLGAGIAWWLRESDPRHAAAHAEVAQHFLAQGMLPEAAHHYRTAVEIGYADVGRAWHGLILTLERQGRAAEARAATAEALERVNDPAWRARLAAGPTAAR